MWEPLPLIFYGYAVHPLTPSRRETRLSSRNRLSTVTEVSTDEHSVMRDVVSLEVGDEVYAFEKYTPSPKEPVEGEWYRGYVVCTTRRPPVTWSLSDPSSSRPAVKAEENQQVFIGIFPASHIITRDQLSDAEGRLPDLATSLTSAANGNTQGRTSPFYHWYKDKLNGAMDPLREEDEDTDAYMSRKSFRLGPPPDQANSSRAGLPVYPTSIRSSSPAESHILKPLPPRPSLKSGDDTASGVEQPIIDEIASALREWHTLMFQYLARRDYKLFHIVREHIEALHLGRRQLLAQTLSAEETVNMRRECVTRLVSGNLVQGLDVIVRHPSWGGLVTVDVEGDIDPRSWVSAVRMYSMQTSLAYLNVDDMRSYIPGTSTDYVPGGPLPTPAHSAFADVPYPIQKSHGRPTTSFGQSNALKPPIAKFYHVFLDLRAFVASPCVPGETAELFFSLYKKQGTQFVTEEFCAILNHNGVLARDPSSKIRTLFVDLAPSNIQDPIYLVCRIVRNGALKIGVNTSSGVSPDGRRGSETLPRLESTLPPPTSGESLNGYSPTPTIFSPRASSNDGHSQFRRPFGCAVLELTQLSKMLTDQADVTLTKEYAMPIYVPTNEASFSMLHQNIIRNNTKEYEKSPRADLLAVSLKIFHGDSRTIVRENTSLLQDIPHTLPLGFPDVVFPGDPRNELYIKLWCGEFSTSHGHSGRLSVANFARGQMGPSANNIQITVEVRDQDGKPVDNVISQGSGEPFMSQFNSMVFQKCNEPTFGELIKIQLPPDGPPQWHLFFTFRNRNPRERAGNKANYEPNDRPFAFAFQPLFPDTYAFVEDGSHTLTLYRAEKLNSLTPDIYLTAQSRLAAGQRSEQIDLFRLAPPLKDTLTVRSSLCSTKFTQNSVLLRLLNWDKLGDKELLSTLLTKFTFVGEGEIVKFLRDIFDALFGILVSHNNQSGEMDLLVFNALVTILGIVQDRRFSNFQPVLDLYIEKHFNCAAASSHMIQSMNQLLLNPALSETASALRAALKVWHYIFKFIARSRELQKAKEVGMGGGATAEHLEASFKRELRSHLSEVTKMMATNSPPSIIGTQTIALQHFTSILPELAKIFTTVELVSIATTFANAVTVGRGKMVIWKLIMYLQIVKGFLFDNPQSRPILVEAVVIWIRPHFGRYDEYTHTQSTDLESARDTARVCWLESIRLCVTIIAVMLDKLQQNLVSPEISSDARALRKEQDNVECLLPLLPRLLDSYKELQNLESRRAIDRTRSSTTLKMTAPVTFPESYPFSLVAHLPDTTRTSNSSLLTKSGESSFYPSLGETAIVFIVLILSSPTKHILNFLESSLDIEGRERFVNLLSQFFKVGTSILENEAFPKTWLNVNILAHKVILKMMDPVAAIMEKEFIPPRDNETQFDSRLWKDCFYMLLKLLSSEQLVIEEFSPQKRRAVWRLAGDIRGEGASILLSMWQALGWAEHLSTSGEPATRYGGYQVYLHSLVGHVVNLCLSHHDQLRNSAVQILYSMIVSEYHESEHFDEIENELVTRLDSLFMSDSKGDDISRAFFIGQLRHLFDHSDVDEQLRERVSNFLDSVDLFLELLLSVRALPEGDEYADDRVIATLRLMNFIRRIGRDEIYIKYVHQLVNMHLQSQNYVEAALTLKLHSDLHEWDLNSFVGPMEDLGLPQQSQFHRKETLCLLILDYLGKGKAWENAIEICKELAYQHAEITFNYARLSEILRHQAALLEHIVTDQRYYPDYYRVTFYGSFPQALKDKRFIYRGYEWEKFGAFCERMLSKHPGAQLLKTPSDPPVDIRFGSDQYIQCTAVTPEPDRSLPIFTNPDVPLPVRTYYEHSAINLFSSSRQLKKTTRDGLEEIWVEKTYFTTEEAFPTVLRRSEVVAVEVVEISPLENALNEVEEKMKELTALNLRYQALAKTAQVVSTNALAMALNSAVDAPADTGIASYRQVFFSPDYIARHPERAELVDKLRGAIDDQVRVIDSCLKLHGHLCPPEFIPFHDTLQKFFKKNFRDEIRRLAVDGMSDSMTISPSLRSTNMASSSTQPMTPYEQSLKRSVSSSSTARDHFVIPPLQLGRPVLTPPPLSPQSPTSTSNPILPTKQTPLQRHLAHLAKHGINGVSSAPGDIGGSDSLSVESPHNSFINVGNGLHTIPSAQASGASVTAPSYIGSIGSFGSLKGRFSRFGSLSFGRRGNSSS
ncbi:cytoplasmic protein [Cyathus striatus]|nr:cytoplasmic protein [Cyathus striatus]